MFNTCNAKMTARDKDLQLLILKGRPLQELQDPLRHQMVAELQHHIWFQGGPCCLVQQHLVKMVQDDMLS